MSDTKKIFSISGRPCVGHRIPYDVGCVAVYDIRIALLFGIVVANNGDEYVTTCEYGHLELAVNKLSEDKGLLMNKDTANEKEEREWIELEKKLDPKTHKCNGKVEWTIKRWFGSWFGYTDKR